LSETQYFFNSFGMYMLTH